MPQTTQSVINFLATSFETVNGTSQVKDKSTGGNVTVSAATFKSLTIQRTSNTLNVVVNISISFATALSIQLKQNLVINIPS